MTLLVQETPKGETLASSYFSEILSRSRERNGCSRRNGLYASEGARIAKAEKSRPRQVGLFKVICTVHVVQAVTLPTVHFTLQYQVTVAALQNTACVSPPAAHLHCTALCPCWGKCCPSSWRSPVPAAGNFSSHFLRVHETSQLQLCNPQCSIRSRLGHGLPRPPSTPAVGLPATVRAPNRPLLSPRVVPPSCIRRQPVPQLAKVTRAAPLLAKFAELLARHL